jgi:hypothetical protein
MDARQQAVRTTLLKTANQPFVYGKLDCCLFVAKCAEEITGVNYAARFNHTNAVGALAYINDAGGLENLVTDLIGAPVEDLATLQDGDPVLIQLPVVGDEILAIFANGQVIAKQESGVIKLPAKTILKGWNL